jgi:hypothetical protein
MALKTISVLIERGLPEHKMIAVSHDRKLLLHRAQEHCLTVDLVELDRHGHVALTELSECAIEEVELLS